MHILEYRSEMGRRPHDGKYVDEIGGVKFPESDPVYGEHGPLMKIWR